MRFTCWKTATCRMRAEVGLPVEMIEIYPTIEGEGRLGFVGTHGML
ncbi:MAG: hypothetical protein IIA44_07065 [Acidobacteria bacterium]|nr:hypothetical protein [Acidobacteriota bacterium]